MRTRFVVLIALTYLVGCGGSDATEASDGADTSGGEHAEGEHAEGDHHGDHQHPEGDHSHRMNDDLRAFHDALAPVWHGEPGEGRAAQACTTAADFERLAGPADAAVDATSTAMHDAAAHLTDVCGDDDQPSTEGAEEALSALHDAFESGMHAWQAANAE